MRRPLVIVLAMLIASCAPVLDRRLMDEGVREFQLGHLVETPEAFKDKLFVLGGIIAETRLTEAGSQIEALFVPVNAYGDLQDLAQAQSRFLAVFPRSKGILDPILYKAGRLITLAGTFNEVRKGKIHDLDYLYPVFTIRQIHLWDDFSQYYTDYRWHSPYYYGSYYYYPYPYPYEPFSRPYPSPYWPYPWYGPLW